MRLEEFRHYSTSFKLTETDSCSDGVRRGAASGRYDRRGGSEDVHCCISVHREQGNEECISLYQGDSPDLWNIRISNISVHTYTSADDWILVVDAESQKIYGCPCDQLPAFIIKRLLVYEFLNKNGIFISYFLRSFSFAFWATMSFLLPLVYLLLFCLQFRILFPRYFHFPDLLCPLDGNELPKTVISREYSSEWKLGDEPYYPVNDEKNGQLYAQYKTLAENESKVLFGERLSEYKYYGMD